MKSSGGVIDVPVNNPAISEKSDRMHLTADHIRHLSCQDSSTQLQAWVGWMWRQLRFARSEPYVALVFLIDDSQVGYCGDSLSGGIGE